MAAPSSTLATSDGIQTPIGVERTSPSPFIPLGAPGVAIYGGYIVENEKDASLTGRDKYVTYSDILANVSIVAAGVRFFLNLVAKSNWTLAPADDSQEAEDLAETVQEIVHDLQVPWHRVVRQAARFKFYGFAILEWTAKLRDDGIIGFDTIDSRSQRTIEQWDTDRFGRVLGVVQRSPQDGRPIYLPRGKVVHLVDDSLHESPEGLGLFRHLVKPARRLERYELLEAWGYESDLRGIPIARGPLTALNEMVKNKQITEEEARRARQPLEDFLRKHTRNPALGMMLDSAPYRAEGENRQPSGALQWDLDIVRGEAGPHEEIAAAIERSMHEIARVLGVEHLLLGSNDRGSYALSADKSQAFGMIVESALTEIRETFRKDLLVPLFVLNGWDQKLMPKFKTDQVQYRDIVDVTTSLKDLAVAGVPLMPDDEAVGEIFDLIGLTRPNPDSEFRVAAMEALTAPPADQNAPSDSSSPAPN